MGYSLLISSPEKAPKLKQGSHSLLMKTLTITYPTDEKFLSSLKEKIVKQFKGLVPEIRHLRLNSHSHRACMLLTVQLWCALSLLLSCSSHVNPKDE